MQSPLTFPKCRALLERLHCSLPFLTVGPMVLLLQQGMVSALTHYTSQKVIYITQKAAQEKGNPNFNILGPPIRCSNIDISSRANDASGPPKYSITTWMT